jgi:hypothetical protein
LVVVGKTFAVDQLTPDQRERWDHVQRCRLDRGLLAEVDPPTDFADWCAELDAEHVDPPRLGHVLALFYRDQHFADRKWPTGVLIQPGVWRQRLPVPPREAAR